MFTVRKKIRAACTSAESWRNTPSWRTKVWRELRFTPAHGKALGIWNVTSTSIQVLVSFRSFRILDEVDWGYSISVQSTVPRSLNGGGWLVKPSLGFVRVRFPRVIPHIFYLNSHAVMKVTQQLTRWASGTLGVCHLWLTWMSSHQPKHKRYTIFFCFTEFYCSWGAIWAIF